MNFRRPRVKNESHLRFVRSLPCVCCGNGIETEAAHIRMAYEEGGKRSVGMAEKPDDVWVVPLCGRHHREQHEMNERAFWKRQGVNPFRVAAFLYASTGSVEAGENIIRHKWSL